MARPTTYRNYGGIMVSQSRFTRLEKLSERAYAKYERITQNINKSYISSGLEKFRDGVFLGEIEYTDDFKTEKGLTQFETQLKHFVSRSWDKQKVEQYKQNLLGAVNKTLGEGFKEELKPILNQIKSVNEFDYIWEQTNGRIDISFFYIRSAEQARKTFAELKSTIKKYIKEYHEKA